MPLQIRQAGGNLIGCGRTIMAVGTKRATFDKVREESLAVAFKLDRCQHIGQQAAGRAGQRMRQVPPAQPQRPAMASKISSMAPRGSPVRSMTMPHR